VLSDKVDTRIKDMECKARPETVACRDASPEPTWMVLRRVSETSLAFHVRSETIRQNPIQSLRSSRWNISLWDSSGTDHVFRASLRRVATSTEKRGLSPVLLRLERYHENVVRWNEGP